MQDLDFVAVAHAHADWKNKLRNAIDNKQNVDAETLCKDNVCLFGKWLYDDATREVMKGVETYHECVDAHAKFHEEAGKIAIQINHGNYDIASDMLKSGTPYANAATGVALALHELRHEVQSKKLV